MSHSDGQLIIIGDPNSVVSQMVEQNSKITVNIVMNIANLGPKYTTPQ